MRGFHFHFNSPAAAVSVLCFTLGLAVPGARASTFAVDRFDDVPSADNCSIFFDNDCSLRGAILKANTNNDLDLISLPSGTYTLSVTGEDDVCAVGDLDLTTDMEIVGQGGVVIDGGGSGGLGDRIFHVHNAVDCSISKLVIEGGYTTTNGGGIFNQGHLSLDGVVIQSCSAGNRGGGIHDNSAFALSIEKSTVKQCTAEAGAGIDADVGVVTITDSTIGPDNNASNEGGGLFVSPDSDVTVERSTIDGNSALLKGGGVFVLGTQLGSVSFVAVNSTITNNHGTHPTDGAGGGIFNMDGVVSLDFVTLTGNTAQDGSQVFNDTGTSGSFTSHGSLFHGDCLDLGSMSSTGGNLESPDNTCGLGAGDFVNQADPQLGAYNYYGGFTRNYRPQPGSNLIDRFSAGCLAEDQRGAPRPVNGACDVGAHEYAAYEIFAANFESGNLDDWSAAVGQ